MRWPWKTETPAARRKRKKAEDARRKAKRERIFDNGIWWAGFFGWHLASGIWIALLLVVLFIEFWIGVARGFYDEFQTLKQAWRERDEEDSDGDDALQAEKAHELMRPEESKLPHSQSEDRGDHTEGPTEHTTPGKQAKLYLLPGPKNSPDQTLQKQKSTKLPRE